MSESPRLPDICPDCTFLAQRGEYDLYWCAFTEIPVARYVGPDWETGYHDKVGWEFSAYPVLIEAFLRAQIEGLVPEGISEVQLDRLNKLEKS